MLALLLACLSLLPVPLPVFFHAPHDPIVAWAISPDFARDRTLFVAQNSFGCLLRTRDGGESFETVNAGLDTGYIERLAISPDFARDRTLWAAEMLLLFVTRDAGDSWTRVPLPVEKDLLTALAVSPAYATDHTVFVGAKHSGLMVSRDDGASWERPALPEKGAVTRIVPSPAFSSDRTALVLMPPGRVLLTTDGGASFRRLRPPPAKVIPAACLTAGAPRPDGGPAPARILLGSNGDGAWSSDDLGRSWQRLGSGFDQGAVLDLALASDPQGREVAFASTVRDGVALLGPGGQWQLATKGLRAPSDQSDEHYFGVMPSPAYASDRTVYLASFEGLQVSADGGFSWRWQHVLPEHFVRNVAFSPRHAEDGTLFVATYGQGTLVTRDDGATWQRLASGAWAFPDELLVSPQWPSDARVLVGSPRALLLTTDGGATFRAVQSKGQPGFVHVGAFAPDYATSGTIFAHILEYGNESLNAFLRSEDRGETWVKTGPPTIHALAFAPGYASPGSPEAGRAWIATPQDVQASTDHGRSWAPLPGLPSTTWYGLDVARLPGGGLRLVAVSPVAGLYASDDDGASWQDYGQGVEGVRAVAVAAAPDFADGGRLFLLTQNEGIYGRRAGEETWTRLGLRGQYALRVRLSPDFERDRCLAVATYAGPWVSRDAGDTWTLLPTPGLTGAGSPPLVGQDTDGK